MAGAGIITYHAIERAKERYGVTMTAEMAAKLIALTKNGRAPCMKRDQVGRIYVGALDGKMMVFALHPEHDRIVTFMPRDYFNPKSRLEHRVSMGRAKKTTQKASVMAVNPTYSRAQMRREARELAEDGEE